MAKGNHGGGASTPPPATAGGAATTSGVHLHDVLRKALYWVIGFVIICVLGFGITYEVNKPSVPKGQTSVASPNNVTAQQYWKIPSRNTDRALWPKFAVEANVESMRVLRPSDKPLWIEVDGATKEEYDIVWYYAKNGPPDCSQGAACPDGSEGFYVKARKPVSVAYALAD